METECVIHRSRQHSAEGICPPHHTEIHTVLLMYCKCVTYL